MPSLSFIKWVAIAAIVGMVGYGGYYVINLKANLAISQANEKKLKKSVEAQQQTIKRKNQEISQIQYINKRLTQKSNAAELEIKKLNEKFDVNAKGTSRDFGAITRVRPGLVNNIINRASDNINRCFEIASGAKLIEGEKNNECQSLIDSVSSGN